jgi:sugar lactone lactonase YvrE
MLSKGRLIFLAATVFALLLVSAAPAAAGSVFPPTIPLPNGWQPEGIAVGRGHTFYVGSIPTGAIFQGDLKTGQGDILVPPQTGRAAIGLEFDQRTGYLFVAGGPTGHGYVYDTRNGDSLADYTFTTSSSVFINDQILTRRAAYFTNSSLPEIYKVPLGPGGKLLDQPKIETIQLTGDWSQQAGQFNANGITATPNEKWLIIVNSALGTLYRVDPETGDATLIELTGKEDTVLNGDGLFLMDHTLYVVQNMLNQIAKIELSDQFTSGEVEQIITDQDFDVPTTIDRFGPYLYVVNARFSTPPTPDTEYWVAQVRR